MILELIGLGLLVVLGLFAAIAIFGAVVLQPQHIPRDLDPFHRERDGKPGPDAKGTSGSNTSSGGRNA